MNPTVSSGFAPGPSMQSTGCWGSGAHLDSEVQLVKSSAFAVCCCFGTKLFVKSDRLPQDCAQLGFARSQAAHNCVTKCVTKDAK